MTFDSRIDLTHAQSLGTYGVAEIHHGLYRCYSLIENFHSKLTKDA